LLVIGALAVGSTATAQAIGVRVQRTIAVGHNVHLRLSAPKLSGGGYYYAVVVLKPYRRYTRTSPPPCSTSSDMQRTDYGFPQDGVVTLALTPARSRTWHWCRGGSYEGAIYAVPHPPPCDRSYPCRSEPYKEPCAGVRPGCVLGVVARPQQWKYPDPLPSPLASGTAVVARFSVRFPASR
jgi:hypothetical protein